MIRSSLVLFLFSATGFATLSQGAGPIEVPKTTYSMEQCLNAALGAKPGEVKALEMELNNQVPVYEFTINLADKSEWEVTCNAMTGRLIGIEEEVADQVATVAAHETQDKTAFHQRAKVGEADARAIALRAHPGKVEGVERKMTAAQVPVYEFEIRLANGVEREVEVDALSGLIIHVEEEIYAIGDD